MPASPTQAQVSQPSEVVNRSIPSHGSWCKMETYCWHVRWFYVSIILVVFILGNGWAKTMAKLWDFLLSLETLDRWRFSQLMHTGSIHDSTDLKPKPLNEFRRASSNEFNTKGFAWMVKSSSIDIDLCHKEDEATDRRGNGSGAGYNC